MHILITQKYQYQNTPITNHCATLRARTLFFLSLAPRPSNLNPALACLLVDCRGDAGDPEFIKRQDQKRSDLDDQLKEYINEWRKQRSKEEDELKKLKEKQAKRKVTRAEEEQRMAQRKKEEEERRVREVEEKKQREIEEKRQRLEEAEKKRQAMLQAMKDKDKKGPNFTIQKKEGALGLTSTQIERNKTKEQLEEEKKISLSFRIKPLDIDNLGESKLREKAQELWEAIIKLETEKYDLEERQKRQDYDLKELKERQKQQLRHKALKKGLDPEALTGKYPVSIPDDHMEAYFLFPRFVS